MNKGEFELEGATIPVYRNAGRANWWIPIQVVSDVMSYACKETGLFKSFE